MFPCEKFVRQSLTQCPYMAATSLMHSDAIWSLNESFERFCRTIRGGFCRVKKGVWRSRVWACRLVRSGTIWLPSSFILYALADYPIAQLLASISSYISLHYQWDILVLAVRTANCRSSNSASGISRSKMVWEWGWFYYNCERIEPTETTIGQLVNVLMLNAKPGND